MAAFLHRLIRPLLTRALQWDAAGGGSRVANWNAPATAVNQWQDSPSLLRSRAEGEFRNNAFARKVVESINAAAIGASGLVPQFKDANVTKAWNAWTERCDAAGRLDWVALSWLVLQTCAVSGEVFIRFVFDESAAVGLRLQVLGPEYLDTARIDRNTFSGIEYNGLQRSAYWLFERHPTLAPLKSVRIPAEQVLHIFRPVAPGSERGVSWLAPVLISLRDLQEYLEAETQRAKIASLYCGFIQVDPGSPSTGATTVPSMEPGSVAKLSPGETFELATPPQGASNFDPFVRALLRKIASGSGVPYEILSNDSSQITFASGRHGLLEYQRHVESLQYVFLIPQFAQPVLDRWMSLAVAMGVIPSVQPARWIAPRLAMLDEGAETRATIAKIRSGFTSRTEVVSQLGWDVAQIDAEIAADNQRADKLGLILDSDPRRVSQMGQEQQSQAQQGGDKQ